MISCKRRQGLIMKLEKDYPRKKSLQNHTG